MGNRLNEAQKREQCDRTGHWRPSYRNGAWFCNRCGEMVAKR